MKAVIICGGDTGSYMTDYIDDGDFIICADSGYDSAKKYGIAPDIIIGDMDSVKSRLDGENIRVYPTRKDFTDSELAVGYAKEHGFKTIVMFGMTGSRMDHTLANLYLLKQLIGFNARIINRNNEICLADAEITLNGKKGDIVSLIPFDGDVCGIDTSGLDYPLKNGTIKSGTSLGVSNVMTGEECKISIKKGTTFVIRSKD